ncbi:RimJ/RimL family protein N-acetyltransferase [Marmoricola sp. OAE513]|uniref:GNAT family N-acetyltransferase n=1 Tax=Marmoricola sp. OAE513 TaxID=2817894 RepID=UPI001AE98B7D
MQALADLSWPRSTARLELRPATADDLDALWKIRRQPVVATWMTHLSDRWEDFHRRAQEPSWFPATLVLERDGTVIGDLMLRIENPWSQGEVAEQAVGVQAEIGWCLDPSFQGHGYATEGVAELIRIAFEDVGLRRVTALCFSANEPSWRLMERLGMRREAHNVRDALHRSGEWMDGYLYALLAEEWRSRQDPQPRG